MWHEAGGMWHEARGMWPHRAKRRVYSEKLVAGGRSASLALSCSQLEMRREIGWRSTTT